MHRIPSEMNVCDGMHKTTGVRVFFILEDIVHRMAVWTEFMLTHSHPIMDKVHSFAHEN